MNAEPIDLLAGLRNGAWLEKQTFEPLRYALPGIIPEGSSLLVGPPKIGKSWFVLALGLGVACGGRMLGQPVTRRPVLYLALEDGDRRLQDRCRILLGSDLIPEELEYLTVVHPGRALDTIETWLDVHRGEEPLVVLDTLGKVMPPSLMGESTYQRDYRIGSELKQLADAHPGSSLITNHHDRKAQSDDFVEKVSGTNGLAGAADTIIVLSRERHDPNGTLQVTGRDVPEGDYAVIFDGNCGMWTLDGADLDTAAARAATRKATTGVGDRMADVIDYVATNPGGVGPTAVAHELELDPKTAQVYLSRAVDTGRLLRPHRGLYTPVGSVGLLVSDDRS